MWRLYERVYLKGTVLIAFVRLGRFSNCCSCPIDQFIWIVQQRVTFFPCFTMKWGFTFSNTVLSGMGSSALYFQKENECKKTICASKAYLVIFNLVYFITYR